MTKSVKFTSMAYTQRNNCWALNTSMASLAIFSTGTCCFGWYTCYIIIPVSPPPLPNPLQAAFKPVARSPHLAVLHKVGGHDDAVTVDLPQHAPHVLYRPLGAACNRQCERVQGALTITGNITDPVYGGLYLLVDHPWPITGNITDPVYGGLYLLVDHPWPITGNITDPVYGGLYLLVDHPWPITGNITDPVYGGLYLLVDHPWPITGNITDPVYGGLYLLVDHPWP